VCVCVCVCVCAYIYIYIYIYIYKDGAAVTQRLRCCATNWKVAGSIPVHVIEINIKSFRSHYSPVVDSACNRNKYQGYFLGVKAAGA